VIVDLSERESLFIKRENTATDKDADFVIYK